MKTIVLFANAAILALSLVAMMIFFMGGRDDIAALIVLLLVAIPASLLTSILLLVPLVRQHGLRRLAAAIRANTPNWVLASTAVVMALLACGELALLVTAQLAPESPAFWQHLPLIAGSCASAAICLDFGQATR